MFTTDGLTVLIRPRSDGIDSAGASGAAVAVLPVTGGAPSFQNCPCDAGAESPGIEEASAGWKSIVAPTIPPPSAKPTTPLTTDRIFWFTWNPRLLLFRRGFLLRLQKNQVKHAILI